MEPGVPLHSALAALKGQVLSDHDLVVVLKATHRLASFVQAQLFEGMAAISERMSERDVDPKVAFDAAAAEISAALRLTRTAAEYDLGVAIELKERLPEVSEALAAGRIDLRMARTIVTGTSHLDPETIALVLEQVVGMAARMTTGQVKERLRRVCAQANPKDAADRYRHATTERRISLEPATDGTADLHASGLAPDRAQAVFDRINQIARSLKTRSEVRTLDQIRADVLLDLLEGTVHAGRRRGTVDIHVDLATLAGLAEDPGDLAGFGPVIADIARQVTEQQQRAQWRYTITDPETELVIQNGTTRRRPTAHQERHVEARNPTCIFPGCRMPSFNCDLDHRIQYAHGGPTTVQQLVPLCRHHHMLRHHSAWTHTPLPDGDHKWVSLFGHTYTTSGRSP
jgi:hypothetical protein